MLKYPPPSFKAAEAGKAKHYHSVARSLVIIILILSAAAACLRCYFREPISDDLLYRYVLDEKPLGENELIREVVTLSDAIESQAIQYFYSNGRTLIHILVQMFAGPWGQTSYSLFIGALIPAIIILFTFYTVGKSRRVPLVWFLVAGTYLYLFQNWSCGWYSICGGMNYLLPMLPVLCTLLALRWINRPDNNDSRNPWVLILLSLLGLVTGWSQECFSIPLSGGIFFWAVLNYKKTNLPFWVLTLALWIGTAVLVFAPGNFIRLSNSPGLLVMIYNGTQLLAGTWLFWLMLAGLVAIRFSGKDKFKGFLSANILEVCIVSVAIAFGMIANTLPQSFNGISFYSAIVLFRMTAQLPEPSGYSRKGIILTALAALAFLVHQTRVIQAGREQMRIDHQFVEDYLASPDGVMTAPEVTVAADCRPFIKDKLWFSSPVKGWLMFTLEEHYGKGMKRLILLEDQDYEAYCSSEEFLSGRNPVDRAVEAYPGKHYLWFRQEYAPLYGDTVRIEYARAPATGIRKLYRSIVKRPAVIESKVAVDSTSVVKGKGGLVGVRTGEKEIKYVEIIRNKERVKP